MKAIFDHPRAILGLYSSTKPQNLAPVLSGILTGKLEKIKEHILIFSGFYCTPMKESEKYRKIMTLDFGNYVDL